MHPPPPRRIAIIGSGPSAFYSAKYLLKDRKDLLLDIIEKLPSPFGLVRYGVAPDHPEVKSVEKDFEMNVMERYSSRVRYFGNVQVGKDVSFELLGNQYDAIILAYGAQSDRLLNITNEDKAMDLSSYVGARSFVGWYNGHPDFCELKTSLTDSNVKSVVIVGHGNVALDCARVLAKKPSELASTDIASYALEQFKLNPIKNITVLGRRGHPQASFTMKELRELTKLENATLKIRKDELDASMNESSKKEIESERSVKRMDKFLRDHQIGLEESSSSKPVTVELRFLTNPVEIILNSQNSFIKGLKVELCTLEGDPGQQKPIGTGKFEVIPCDLLIRSVGYKSVKIPGIDSSLFDDRKSIMKHSHGRVKHGLYCTGWLKRGPSGIIGTNIPDALETVSTLLEDFDQNLIPNKPSTFTWEDPVAKIATAISWEKWKRLDEFEINLGAKSTPPKIREKLVRLPFL